MINISLIKTVLLCFMLVFIYGNSFSQEFEQSVIPEIICEAEGSDESESKESFRSEKKIIFTFLIKYFTPVKNKIQNFYGFLSSFNSGNSSYKSSYGFLFCNNSCMNIYYDNLQYHSSYHYINSLFVNISYLKQLRVSNMRC